MYAIRFQRGQDGGAKKGKAARFREFQRLLFLKHSGEVKWEKVVRELEVKRKTEGSIFEPVLHVWLKQGGVGKRM